MLFLDDPDWTPPQDFPELTGEVGFDFETYDPALKTHGSSWAWDSGPLAGKIVGVAVATDERASYYPVGHKGGGNMNQEQVFNWLRGQLKKEDLTIVCHNAMYELGWLRRYNFDVRCKVQDTMTAAPLIDENRMSYSLDSLLKSYLGSKKKFKELKKYAEAFGLKDAGAEMWKLPAPYVGEYAETDAFETLKLWKKFKGIMTDQSLWDIYHLEIGLLPLLVEMRRRGVRVDEEGAERLVKDLKKQEEDIQKQIKTECGRYIDLWAAADIASAFDARGLTYPKTAKTQAPSFKADWLEKQEDPVSKLIVKGRKLNKTRCTFIEGYVLGHVVNGRIHGELSPLRRTDDEGGGSGTVTGRFSSSMPNLQNLPSLDRDREAGLMVRSLFLPEEGEKWAALDYSQQEPRLTIHYAYLRKCKMAAEAVRRYNEDPSTDYHSMVAELTGLPRKQAKVINLGLAYGMGGAKLCRGLGLPTKWIETKSKKMVEIAGDEGQEIIDRYHENAPFIKELFDECTQVAEARGFIRTILGRRRRFHASEFSDTKYADFPYKAMNALIQGSAADQVKKSMLDMWKEGIVPLVTVHDEVGISTGSRDLTDRCIQIMLDSVKLVLPMKVDAEVGLNWGHANATKGFD